MEKLLFESDGKNISENKKKIGRKLGVIFLIAGGIGFLLIFFGSLFLGILCAWREGGLLDRFFCRIGTKSEAKRS